MFELVTFRQVVRVPPKLWSKDIKKSVLEALKAYEGKLSKQHGVLLRIVEVNEVGEGRILPGDGAVYFPTVYTALVFKPELNEVVEGEVVDVVEFGAFVRIGPLDGLVHISQIADDYFSYSKDGSLLGKETKKVLKIGDAVRARIISISYKAEPAKLGLTMRQPGLGKLEWLAEARENEGKKAK